MKWWLWIAAAAASLTSGCVSLNPRDTAAPASAPTVSVKVIAFNDFHGNLRTPSLRVPIPDATQSTGFRLVPAGGVEQFSALVKSLRQKNPNSVVVSAGDMVGATPLMSAFFQDEPTIEAMNLVGVDIHGVGNHEFDYGVRHLKRLQTGGCAENKAGVADCSSRDPARGQFTGAKFSFLAANVLENATQKTLFPAYVIKEFEGVKIGFIGLTLEGTAAIVRPGGAAGVTFLNEVAAVNALLPELKSRGVNAIVVLMHEGAAQSMGGGINDCKGLVAGSEADFGRAAVIAKAFDPAVDLVVSGHSHRFYVCEVGGKLLTSAGSYGTLVTEIDIAMDRTTGKVVSKKALNHVVNPAGMKDPQLTALVDRYSQLSSPLENRVVAKVSRELPILANAAGESALGNLVADAHLQSAAAPDKGGAVIAFNNPRSLRAPIIPGADGGVRYGELFRTQPFQNDLVIMNLTGRQIKELLEQQFSGAGILNVSTGFQYTWDNAMPSGSKIVPGSMKLHGRPIEAELQYRVVANSFIAGGSEGMGAFLSGTDRQVGVLDLEALVNFLSTNTPYVPTVPGRIGRLN